MARNKEGKLYCWGYNNGVIGYETKVKDYYKPQLIEDLIHLPITEVSCGESHSLVLTKDGKVYSWGWNEWGQVGNRMSGFNSCQLVPYFVDELNGEKVKSISCGCCHSLALTESGRVYHWGNNGWGHLDRDTRYSNCPKQVELIEDVIIDKISCGSHHCLLLSREGDIYVFGRNSYRELGINTETDRQLTPIKIKIRQNFKDMSSHWSQYFSSIQKIDKTMKFTEIASHWSECFSSALSSNGVYYIWGKVSEEEVIREPKETQFNSFDEIFMKYFGITYKPIEGKVIQFSDKFIQIEYYKRKIFGKIIDKNRQRTPILFKMYLHL